MRIQTQFLIISWLHSMPNVHRYYHQLRLVLFRSLPQKAHSHHLHILTPPLLHIFPLSHTRHNNQRQSLPPISTYTLPSLTITLPTSPLYKLPSLTISLLTPPLYKLPSLTTSFLTTPPTLRAPSRSSPLPNISPSLHQPPVRIDKTSLGPRGSTVPWGHATPYVTYTSISMW